MSEFEKELMNKVSPHDRTFKGHELFLGGFLLEHFKDWQPPKPLVVVPRIGTDYFDVDLLSSSIDEIERVLIGNKSDEVNAVYLKNAIRFIKTHINGMEENKEWINQIIELVPVDEVEG